MNFPKIYSKFLQSLGENEVRDIFNESGYGASFYGSALLVERNATYEVALYEPQFYMIAQDGDMGFFIKLGTDDTVYANDLGALGSLPMERTASDVFEFVEKITSGDEKYAQLE